MVCCADELISQFDLETVSCEERDLWIDAFKQLKTMNSKVGRVFNVQREAYLDKDMNWQGDDLENSFTFGKKLGEGGNRSQPHH
jgi:hypothetical protein